MLWLRNRMSLAGVGALPLGHAAAQLVVIVDLWEGAGMVLRAIVRGGREMWGVLRAIVTGLRQSNRECQDKSGRPTPVPGA